MQFPTGRPASLKVKEKGDWAELAFRAFESVRLAVDHFDVLIEGLDVNLRSSERAP